MPISFELMSRIAGYIGTASAVVCFQVKKRENLLICQIISNIFVSLSFLLLGQIAGGSICFIATGHTIVNYIHAKKEKKPKIWEMAMFIALYAGASVFSWLNAEQFVFPFDVFPFFCALLFCFGISIADGKKIRLCFLANALLWILYDCFGATFAFANLITHLLVCGSNIISIIRYDIIKPKKE